MPTEPDPEPEPDPDAGPGPGVADVLARPVARELLTSRIPARVAYVAQGEPRVVPLWFHWTGRSVVLATFAGTAKLAHLRTGSVLAVSIDTEEFPYRGLQIRGPVTLTQVDGLVPEYVTAMHRYVPEAELPAFRRRLERVTGMTRIELHARSARLMDMTSRGR